MSSRGSGSRKQKTRKQTANVDDELLNAVLDKGDYQSSEDDDYAPARDTHVLGAARGGSASTRGTVRPEAPEDVPLAQRRQQLVQSPRGNTLRQPAASGRAPAQPSAHLPTDVLGRILGFACTSNAVPTIAAAACVSKTWRGAVDQMPRLWHTVDLSDPRRKVSDVVIARMAARRWSELVFLSLSGCNKLSDASLKALAEQCPKLCQLDLSYCTCFTEAGLTSALSVMLLRRAADGAHPLKRLNLSCIQVKPRASGIDHLLRQVLFLQSKNEGGPVLEELMMEGCPLMTHQGLRAACDASVEQRRPLLRALRTLRLTQSAGARANFQINIERLQYACPHLEELGLNGLGGAWGWDINQTPGRLPAYLSQPSTLPGGPDLPDAMRTLRAGVPPGAAPGLGSGAQPSGAHQDAGPSSSSSGGGGLAVCLGFPELRVCEVGTTVIHTEGTLSGRSHLHDAALARLLSRSPLLEHLDLSGVERLTSGGLAAAVHPAAPLRTVALARSSVCCDEAIVDLAQRHRATLEGVDVSWGGPRISDAAAASLARCPHLATANLAGTAVTEAGVRAVVAAAVEREGIATLQLDINSCRGVGREVRQAASQGMERLVQVLRV